MRFRHAAVLVILLGSGCGATAIAPGAAPPLLDPESRFVGTWLVEETVPHATYFASLYAFGEEGSVTLLEDLSYDQGIVYPEVSWAGNAWIVCTFGERWWADDAVHLEVEGVCSDELARPIRIAFDPEASGNTEGVGVRLVSVGGDTQMWSEPGWGWHFIKCAPDLSNCQGW